MFWSQIKQIIEVVGRGSETQLHVDENLIYLTSGLNVNQC